MKNKNNNKNNKKETELVEKVGHLAKAHKAYNNDLFINSPGARTIRILSEYIEPHERIRNNKIRHTIVFFGSARIIPQKTAMDIVEKLKSEIASGSGDTNDLNLKLKYAEVNLEMSKYYEDTVALAKMLTEWSMSLQNRKFVVCSGGGPGIMEAANKGATLAGGLSMGLNISLPFEQYPNIHISPELNFEFHYFFMRKFWFAYLAKALIIMPGGFGTLDELFEILTLIQTEKLHKKMSVVVYGREFWNKIVNFEELVRLNVISAQDLELFRFADTPQEAFDFLTHELTERYVKNNRRR